MSQAQRKYPDHRRQAQPWTREEREFLFKLTHDERFYDEGPKAKRVRTERAAVALNTVFGKDRRPVDVSQALHNYRSELIAYDRMHPDAMPVLPTDLELPERNRSYYDSRISTWHTYNDDLGLTELEYAFWLRLNPDYQKHGKYHAQKIATEVNSVYHHGRTIDALQGTFQRFRDEGERFYQRLEDMGLDVSKRR